MPKISVVIPIYNSEKYICECLDSVIGQTLSDIEIICVDDGSNDSSLKILQGYAERDGRIRIITKKNSGYGHSMNVGFAAATGEYIAIVESDDYVENNMLSELYACAKKHNADVVKSDFYEFTTPKIEDEKYVRTPSSKRYYNRVLNAKDNPIIFGFILNTWTGIYRREFIIKNGIKHNETPGAAYQDNGFFFQTTALAKRTVFKDGAYYHYRQDNPNSSINSKDKVFCISEEYAFIREFIEKRTKEWPGLYPLYHARKFHNYLYSYRRIACKHKMKFLERFAHEFSLARDRSEFDASFLDSEHWELLRAIMDNPTEFYYRDTTEYLEARAKSTLEKINFISQRLITDGVYKIREIKFLNHSSLSTREARERYIDLLEKKVFDLDRELSELKANKQYPAIYVQMKKQDTKFLKLKQSLRTRGVGATLKKIIEKFIHG